MAEIAAAGGTAVAVLLDVTDAASVATGVERAARPERRLDVVVNNAGLAGQTPLDGDERSDRAFERIFDVNVTGTWRVLRAALPFLADGGRVVNLSSVSGRFGVPGQSALLRRQARRHRHDAGARPRARAAEDHRQRGLPRLGRHRDGAVRHPGLRQGDGAHGGGSLRRGREDGPARARSSSRTRSPASSRGSPSDDARNVTGQSIVIDGGQVMP